MRSQEQEVVHLGPRRPEVRQTGRIGWAVEEAVEDDRRAAAAAAEEEQMMLDLEMARKRTVWFEQLCL